jgi:hypothetical protein
MTLSHRGRVVYLCDLGVSTTVAGVTAKILRKQVVLDTGDVAYLLAKNVGDRGILRLQFVAAGEKLMLRIADRVVVRGRAHLRLLPKPNGHLVPDVAPPSVLGVPPPNRTPRDGGSFTMAVVGTLNWSRTLQRCYGWELLEALALLPDKYRGIVVGDGNGLAWLEARARELNLGHRCEFLGRVPRSDLGAILAGVDVALSTQTNDLVGAVRTTGKLPLYLSYGCPVLASDVGEAARILGPLGWTVPYDGLLDLAYPRRLAECVAAWEADPASQQVRRCRARELAEEHFDPLRWREDLRNLVLNLR